MTNSPPENDAPVALRAATQLSAASAPRAASAPAPASLSAAAVRTQPAQAGGLDSGLGGEDLTLATLAMSGMVVLAGGWLVRRRRRLAEPQPQPQPEPEPEAEAAVPQGQAESAGHPEAAVPPEQVEVAQPEPESTAAVDAEVARVPEPLPQADVTPEPEPQAQPVAVANAEPDAALSWAPDSDAAFNSSWAAVTPPVQRQPSRMDVATQKRLIKSLMWVRTAAGAAAILAAIAIVVFWSIEMIDRRAGETGLNLPLLLGALGGWALSWGAGRLANLLHRLFFHRVHPKFDT